MFEKFYQQINEKFKVALRNFLITPYFAMKGGELINTNILNIVLSMLNLHNNADSLEEMHFKTILFEICFNDGNNNFMGYYKIFAF